MSETYYYCTNGDGTTLGRFRPFGDVGVIHGDDRDLATAPDYDPDPDRECGGGLHVVAGHPLNALAFVQRVNPVFYVVMPVDPHRMINGKCRCRGVRRLRVIDQASPEMDQGVLAKLAKNAPHWRVRAAAAARVEDQGHRPAWILTPPSPPHWRVRAAAAARVEGKKRL
jgi:hypothetical protein